jgi:S1-C subfamily serine protease
MKRAFPLGLLLVFIVRAPAQSSKLTQRVPEAEASTHTPSRSASAVLTPSQIFTRARASVVVIVASDQNDHREALGSGFIVGRGKIVTNHHVVEGMNSAFVVFSDGAVKQVSKVVADSAEQDLIILAVGTDDRPSVALGDELSLHQGDSVFALGAPKGLELTFTNGIVSSFRKSNAQFLIQTTAPIAPGSSGGPLLDHAGRVVGVTTSMLSDAPGIYFSVGIGDVKRLLRTPSGVALAFDEWAKQQSNGHQSSKSAEPSQGQSAQTPSLQETISWMTSFLDAHGEERHQPVNLGSTSIDASQSNSMRLPKEYVAAFLKFSESNSTDNRGCAIFIKHDYATPTQLYGVEAQARMDVVLIPLGAVDPASVRLSMSHVVFETTNNLEKIVDLVPLNESKEEYSEYTTYSSWVVLDSPEDAERFANALKHAVTLCGGTKAPF